MKFNIIMILTFIISISFLGCSENKTENKKHIAITKQENKNSIKNNEDTKFFDDVFAKMVNMNYEKTKKYLNEINIEYKANDTDGVPKRSVIIIKNPNDNKDRIAALYAEDSQDNFEAITYFKGDKIVTSIYIDGKLKFNINKEVYLDDLKEVKEYLFNDYIKN